MVDLATLLGMVDSEKVRRKGEDCFLWEGSDSGLFTIKDLYNTTILLFLKGVLFSQSGVGKCLLDLASLLRPQVGNGF